ncbi:pyocin activator PrtN family protein [Pseudomonas panipatensis]|uniref:Pyocin activator protein PrtN n=1 Tax=Pseudomonas panipatensis TaxID=428992 RepID=A0A1G8CT20_9PSED|nr:pyocin activator PrtN family protein [Pseudomonas panipatensis]SDH48655.1 Pyocin activator protein PrtN [Pseudomonas panipatensis]SMP63600.1 Pyocin activator protein PrtN [Pseudomonas panipatensis]
MNTAFLLMAQYNGAAIIPIDRVCADYFSHLTPEMFQRKVMSGDIDLPIVRLEGSQKTAKGVHLADLASYLDARRLAAKKENDQLHGRHTRRAG